MVEQWSSKSYVWVRFLLPLISIKKRSKQSYIYRAKHISHRNVKLYFRFNLPFSKKSPFANKPTSLFQKMSSFTPTHSFLLRSYFLCKILFFSSLTGLGGLLQGSHTNNYITKGTNATCLRNLYYSFTILTSSTYSKLGVPKNDNTLLSYLNLPLSTNHTLNYVQL